MIFIGEIIGAVGFMQLSDKYGRKQVLMLGMLVALVGVLLSAFAPSIEIYFFFCIVYGVGESLCTSLSFILFIEQQTSRNKDHLVVIFWAIAAIKSMLAAILFYVFRNYEIF